MNKPPVRIAFSTVFRRDLKRLIKKYRHINEDVEPLLEKLNHGETPGDQIPGVGYTVYKERLPNRDSQSGQSGGYRIIYYILTEKEIIILTIYAKTERSDVTPDRIRQIIEEEFPSTPPAPED